MSFFEQPRLRMIYLSLLCILITAALFRFYGLNWGKGAALHIDEENVQAVTWRLAENIAENGSLNPRFSAYGALLFYLILPLKLLVAPEQLLLASRILAALMGLLTVYFVFILGCRFRNPQLGLLSAMLCALTVILWRESHFYTAETPLLLFVTLALNAGLGILQTLKKRYYFAFAIFLGLAISVKSIAILLVLPLGCAHLAYRPDLRSRIKAMGQPSIWATLLLAGAVFLALNPYCVLDATNYWQRKTSADLLWNALMVKGSVLPPWTVQFLSQPKGAFELYALYPWALGPFLALASLFGIYLALCSTRAKSYYLLSFILPYLILTASWQVKFIRYTTLIIPALCVLAADSLLQLKGNIRKTAFIVLVLASFGYSAAYLNIYRQPDSRYQAHQYLSEQAQGKKVFTEMDEGFLLSKFYQSDQPPYIEKKLDFFYQQHTPHSRQLLIKLMLKEADYLALSTNNYERFARLPLKFPTLAGFYHDLFAEKLGFEIVKTFEHQPQFMGITISDHLSELTFRLFDHPKITVFKKIRNLQAER